MRQLLRETVYLVHTIHMKRIVAGLFGMGVLLLLWSLLEPRLVVDEKHETAEIPNLPEEWEGHEIGLIADIQVGSPLPNLATARRIIRKLVQRRPAAVLIAGDFVYATDERTNDLIEQAVDLIRPLVEAGIPTFAVLGNHDYAAKQDGSEKDNGLAERLRSELSNGGVRVLQNEAVPLRPETGTQVSLYLVGVGSEWAEADNVEAALSAVPEGAPRIVLVHNPDTFRKIPPGAAPFAVAGHTHGGQVRMPFISGRRWMSMIQGQDVPADDWAPNFGAAGNHLYVNRGIGFSRMPIRLNAPPEVTIFTLIRKTRS